MDFQLSIWGFLATAAYIIIFGFFTRFLAAKYPDSMFGKFSAFIY